MTLLPLSLPTAVAMLAASGSYDTADLHRAASVVLVGRTEATAEEKDAAVEVIAGLFEGEGGINDADARNADPVLAAAWAWSLGFDHAST